MVVVEVQGHLQRPEVLVALGVVAHLKLLEQLTLEVAVAVEDLTQQAEQAAAA